VTRPGSRLPPETRQCLTALIEAKPYLGPERLAWDLRNGDGLIISPATIKRLKRNRHEALLPLPRHHPCDASTSATRGGTQNHSRDTEYPAVWS
jgi:hypothetical protein